MPIYSSFVVSNKHLSAESIFSSSSTLSLSLSSGAPFIEHCHLHAWQLCWRSCTCRRHVTLTSDHCVALCGLKAHSDSAGYGACPQRIYPHVPARHCTAPLNLADICGHMRIGTASANVRIHDIPCKIHVNCTVRNCTTPHGLLRTCGKNSATVRTIQDMFSFHGLLFAEPRDGARKWTLQCFTLCLNSSMIRAVPYGSTRFHDTVRYTVRNRRVPCAVWTGL